MFFALYFADAYNARERRADEWARSMDIAARSLDASLLPIYNNSCPYEYCFYTPGIISGVLVMLLLVVVTIIGVLWLASLQSPVRFEDPRAKPVQLSPVEASS